MSEAYPPRETLRHYRGLPLTGSPNSGHTAPLRSAKIRQSRTSYVRKTLDDIALEDDDKWKKNTSNSL